MENLFKQLNDKATTEISNQRNLARFVFHAGNTEAAQAITRALKRNKLYWRKIRALHPTDFKNYKSPKGLIKSKTVCLYVVLDPEVSVRLLAELKAHSSGINIDYQPKKSKWLFILCFLQSANLRN